MKNLKLDLIFILFSFFIVGCVRNISDNSQYPTSSLKSYEEVLTQMQEELNSSYNIDIFSVIKQNITNEIEVLHFTYEINKCNFSAVDAKTKDLLIQMDFDYYDNDFDRTIVCAYTLIDGSYTNILTEVHKYVEVRTVNILGDSKMQIEILTDDSGNNFTIAPIRILSYHPETKKFECIFDEILYGYNYLPFKKTANNAFYNISFENQYIYEVSSDGKTQDIVFKSKIFEQENIVLQEGTTRFIYNGEKYISENYYDYRKIANSIYDSYCK